MITVSKQKNFSMTQSKGFLVTQEGQRNASDALKTYCATHLYFWKIQTTMYYPSKPYRTEHKFPCPECGQNPRKQNN